MFPYIVDVDKLLSIAYDFDQTKRTDDSTKSHTVKTQIMTIPTKTAKKIQPDQAVVLKPANILATITAEIAIVYYHI